MLQSKKRILVSGGAGYLGSVLTDRLLKRGHSVCVLDSLMYGPNSLYRLENQQARFFKTLLQQAPAGYRPQLDFVQADIRDYRRVSELLREGQFDAVVHLAAIVGVASCEADLAATQEINVEASLELLRLARELGVGHFLFASTYSVYGNQGGRVVDETANFNPTSAYEQSKIVVEQKLQAVSDLPWSIFRFATACGLSFRTRFDLLSNQLTVDALEQESIEIFQGADMRSFVHVRDIARAVTAVIEAPLEKVNREVFNVGEAFRPGSKPYGTLTCSKDELALLIKDCLQELGEHVVVQKQEFAEDARNAILVADKLRECLGITPEFSLRDAVSEIAGLVSAHSEFDPRSVEYYEQAGVLYSPKSVNGQLAGSPPRAT
jgi:nucleoside-diphosphate-sugar epimerase